ncbi:MAG TPA: ABC transporter permease subunit [Acidimicrobiales bacterium]|nr:ABC transporter permease subunit [Acidimicrobiales bacterium]
MSVAGRGAVALRVRRRLGVLLPLAPFAAYAVLFLGLPTLAVALGAFQKHSGGWTLNNVRLASRGVYRKGFMTSLELATITAVVPAVLGVFLAYAVHTARPTSALKRVVSTASGVFANFGGVPLAFLFIASLGNTGLATKWLNSVGLNPYKHGFNLYAFSGIVLVYMYFQIPLMVLVITPALEGLRPAWREAAHNLGASSWSYWRHVGVPVLLPSFLGALLLLFGSGLSAYATAEALTNGSVAITSIQIGSFLNGNVISGQENVGKALGFGMIVVIFFVMLVYATLQRRASRWLQ